MVDRVADEDVGEGGDAACCGCGLGFWGKGAFGDDEFDAGSFQLGGEFGGGVARVAACYAATCADDAKVEDWVKYLSESAVNT